MKKLVLAALLALSATAQATAPAPKQVKAFPGLYLTSASTFSTAGTAFFPDVVFDQPVRRWRWFAGENTYSTEANNPHRPPVATALEAEFGPESCGVITTEIFGLGEHPGVNFEISCDKQHVLLKIFPVEVR